MRICSNEKCQKTIPLRIEIDGKVRILQHRKYCLECSPFGKHNTKPFGFVRLSTNGRTCPICNKSYHIKGFVCGSCRANLRRFDVKEKAIAYLGGKCKICGYNKCPAALVFHHRNPEKKRFNIGGNHTTSVVKLNAELDKCDLLCQNCHTELHWNEHEDNRQMVKTKFAILKERFPSLK